MLASIRSGFLFVMAALTLQGTVFATDYCPTSFYGYICGLYYYSCSYCDASNGCASGFVATATMHDTGGNFDCCDANAGGCTDPITDGTLLSARQTPARAAHRNLVLYVHSRQRDFIGEKDRFLRPGRTFRRSERHSRLSTSRTARGLTSDCLRSGSPARVIAISISGRKWIRTIRPRTRCLRRARADTISTRFASKAKSST